MEFSEMRFVIMNFSEPELHETKTLKIFSEKNIKEVMVKKFRTFFFVYITLLYLFIYLIREYLT